MAESDNLFATLAIVSVVAQSIVLSILKALRKIFNLVKVINNNWFTFYILNLLILKFRAMK